MRFAAVSSLLVLFAAACSPAASDTTIGVGSTDPPPVPTDQTPAAVTITNAVVATTQAGPTFGPKEVSIEWGNCFETQGAQFGDINFSCSTGRLAQIPEFTQANFNGFVNFETNESGEVIAVSIAAGGYNGSCFWNPEPDTQWSAPLEDGKATVQGVLFGTELCDGYQLAFEAVWDQTTLGFTMDGQIEPVG